MSSSTSASQPRLGSPSRPPRDSDEGRDDVRQQVLQHTLEEVSARQQECCVICLDAITEACEAVPCKHGNFDFLCLVSWLQESPKCPLCKATVASVRYGFQDGNSKTFAVIQPPSGGDDRQTRPTTSTSTSTSTDPLFLRFSDRPRRRRYHDRPHRSSDLTTATSEISRRREVYRHHRYSKHVGSNRLSRYRELTPHMFCTDEDLTSRARMWIRRELQVFSFLSLDETDDGRPRLDENNPQTTAGRRRANNAEFLLEYIIAVLKSVDIMGSCGQAEDMISDFLGRDSTRLFLHELRAWLRSPYTKLADWDRAVQYDESGEASNSRVQADRPRHEERCDGGLEHGRRRGDFYRPNRGRVEKTRPTGRREFRSRGRDGGREE